MTYLEHKGSKHIYTQDISFLSIHYFLVHSICYTESIYGIQILSCRDHDLRHIHSETIHHISYSPEYVLKIIQLCMDYLVTPTDLFSSVDALMDMFAE